MRGRNTDGRRNVRELQNSIGRAIILSPHAVLRAPASELEPFNVHGLGEINRIVSALPIAAYSNLHQAKPDRLQ